MGELVRREGISSTLPTETLQTNLVILHAGKLESNLKNKRNKDESSIGAVKNEKNKIKNKNLIF